MCVQRFDDSQCSAIHTTFRASLRSSSMREPRDPLLKVLILITFQTTGMFMHKSGVPMWGRRSTLVSTGLKGRRSKDHSIMIPPQVHLRRPCYDFYFL